MECKTQRSEYDRLNDEDRAILAKLPAGVPTLGLRWHEVEDYVDAFQGFRKAILKGHLFNTYHAWRVIASRRSSGKLSFLVDDDGMEEALEEDWWGDEIKRFKKTGNFPLSDAGMFVIEDVEAFIVKAWTIGVFRAGFKWTEGGGEFDEDQALQYAHYGFQNQG